MSGGLVVVLVALVVVVLGPRLASARAVAGTAPFVARKGCPAPRECCRYPEHSGKFRSCCDAYGCCPDCDGIYVYKGHGPYDVRQDCVDAYECCLHPFLSEEFHRCCFEHGCCPVCGSVSDGCCFNNVMYSWSSVVLAFPRCCLDLVCGARLSDASPPYLTAVIVPVYSSPTTEDHVCDPVRNDHCVEPKGIIRADGSEWLETPCSLCRCDNGRVTCSSVRPHNCPPAPHPHCRELPGDCCPSWDCYNVDRRIWSSHFSGILKLDHRRLRVCIDEDGRVHDFGNQWWGLQDPCVLHTCTEDGITRTRTSCPQLPPPPYPACHLLKSDGECCFTWRCSICTDEDGTVHNLGDEWLDPQDACVYYVCTEDGVSRARGDCTHLPYRPRQACLFSDDGECCQTDCSTCIDEDGEPHETGDKWEDPHDSCFYYMCTDDGISRAPKDCSQLPPRPHQDCHLFKGDGECCQTWRCSGCVYDSVFHGYGESWQEPTNPCIQYLCTENNISKAYETCPAAPTKPHSRCQLVRPDGQCCMEWKCPSCPDPRSFDRVCTRYFDQCKSDLECPPGHQCCLVAGCGKECVRDDDDGHCYTTPMCQQLGGQCSDACGRDKGLITGVCSSDDCVCCVPETNSCKLLETMTCLERGGRCDSTCGIEEDPLQELCLTEDCLCCVPKRLECLNTSFCHLLAGRCARNCSRGDNAFPGMCAGSDCVCCVPEQRPCHNSSSCLRRGGRCASDCVTGEIPVLGKCLTRSCVCCVPEPNRCDTDTFGCRMKGGHCDQACGRDEDSVKHLCNTDDCLCCVPKCSTDPFACRSKGGHCDNTCGRGEVPVKHLCDTESCFCCVPAFVRCASAIGCSVKGGRCDRMCSRDEEPVQHLCDSNDCFCCLPRRRQCQTTNLCHGMGGACASDCSMGEHPIPGVCENRDCVCCVPEVPPCDTTTFACRSSGGHCSLRCGREEDPVRHLCTNGDCLCCVPKPVRCQDSSLCYKYLGGQCARECGRGETPIDGVCETRLCVCCVPGFLN